MHERRAKPTFDMRWLETATGRSLLQEECQRVSLALDSIFGDQFLQIGQWGGDQFLGFARTRRAFALADECKRGTSFISALNCVAVASDSIDAVLLPHVLETNDDPHGVLREVDRILRSDGYVVILGFNPMSWWGLRHLLSRHRFPSGVQRMISEHRLRDWLRLLNFSVNHVSSYFFHAPIIRRSAQDDAEASIHQEQVNFRFDETAESLDCSIDRTDETIGVAQDDRKRAGNRFPDILRSRLANYRVGMLFAGCYILVARKELFTVTPIRPVWKRRRRLVGGLVNPTTRNSA